MVVRGLCRLMTNTWSHQLQVPEEVVRLREGPQGHQCRVTLGQGHFCKESQSWGDHSHTHTQQCACDYLDRRIISKL